jgi:hypothetical protein
VKLDAGPPASTWDRLPGWGRVLLLVMLAAWLVPPVLLMLLQLWRT